MVVDDGIDTGPRLKLYSRPAALRDVTSGNNGAYEAARGWDACTGLGSPDGQKLAGALGAA